MKRLVLLTAALGGLTLATSTPAKAGDWYWYGGHARLHDDLDHSDFHRELIHRDAHRYPLSWYEHDRLHDELDHDAFHDELRHRSYHRGHHRGYGYYGHGIGIRSGGFSLWIGR